MPRSARPAYPLFSDLSCWPQSISGIKTLYFKKVTEKAAYGASVMFGVKTTIFQNEIKKICEREFQSQTIGNINERPVEFEFVFKHLARVYPKTVLDVGTGMTALPHLMRSCGFHVTAIDNVRDYWPNGMINRHYHVIDDDITNPHLQQKYEFITCVSVLEHITNHEIAMKNMFSLLSPGGHLVLTCPYTEMQYVKNVYDLHDSEAKGKKIPFETQSFSRKEVEGWLSGKDIEIVEQEYWHFFTGDFWTCGVQIPIPKRASKTTQHQISCLLFRKN